MDGFNFSDISIGGGIVLVVLIFTLVGFVRGMARMFFGIVALAAAGIAAYWGFQRGDSIAGFVISNPDPWMSGAIGIIMGLAVFFVARALFLLIVKPIKVVDGKKQNKGGLGGVLGIIGGLAFAWFAISGVRYVGTLAELDWIKTAIAEEGKIQKVAQPTLVKVKDLIDSSLPGKFHRDFDFLNDRARTEVAKLKLITENKYAMNIAARDAGVMKAFGQPEIRKLLESSQELEAYIEESKFSHLLESKKICEVCDIPAAQETLAGSDVTKALGIKPKPKKKPKKKAAPKS